MQGGISVARETGTMRLARVPRDPDDYPPTQVKRLRDAAMIGMENPLWGSELGRLFLNRSITGPMLAAGKRWARVAARYQIAIDGKPSLKSAALERGAPAEPPDPDSEEGEEISRRDRDALKAMKGARGALLLAGKRAEAVVRAVVERDEAIGQYEVSDLKRGLDALAIHWEFNKPSGGRQR